MRMKLGLLVLLMIVGIGSSFGENGKYGFTGEVMEVTLAEFSKHAQAHALDFTADAAGSSKVKALAVGAKKLTAPVSPYSPHFVYYSYNLITIDEWWIGMIVTNFDDVSHEIKAKIEVTGVLDTEVEQEFTIEPYTAVLISAKIELPPRAGMFHLRGRVTGDTVSASSVKTKLFIFDVL